MQDSRHDMEDLQISLRGIAWTMPRKIIEVLFGWEEAKAATSERERWGIVPVCIWWTIWKQEFQMFSKIVATQYRGPSTTALDFFAFGVNGTT